MLFLKNINPNLEIQLKTEDAGDQSCAKYLMGFVNVFENTFVLDNDGLISNPSKGICDNTLAYHYWANGKDSNIQRIKKDIQKLTTEYPI
jgi:hypothetical protein